MWHLNECSVQDEIKLPFFFSVLELVYLASFDILFSIYMTHNDFHSPAYCLTHILHISVCSDLQMNI